MVGEEIALARYFSICNGITVPCFKLLKKIECKKCKNLEEMWNEHKRGMKIFKKEQDNLTDKDNAEFSLLDLKCELANTLLRECIFCERKCKTDRTKGKLGWCRVGAKSHITSMLEHRGEESCLVPSGTIFFSGCNWHCAYCQNWDISQFPEKGRPMQGKEIAAWIDEEARYKKIRNVNFVGGEPTPNLHTIIDTARNIQGNVPVVWNSNMYMSGETMKLLDGIVDVYLADFRYGKDECAQRLSKVPNYTKTIHRNFKIAAEQAEMLIRILVLPNHVECCVKEILKWIGKNIANKAHVNLMSQYRPTYKAREYEDVARVLNNQEFSRAIQYLREFGIKYYEIQG